MKVYIVGGGSDFSKMFQSYGWEVTTDLFKADLVQFTGGADVTPEIYGEKNTDSHNDFNRDLREAAIFTIAKRIGKPMVGVCRGGQFLNVMCGGSMIQHVEGHTKAHTITAWYKGIAKTVLVTSTHHQMMVPEPDNGDVLAYTDTVGDADTEVIMYWEDMVLCFQPHPEFGGHECQEYYFELIERCLGLKA
jgi:gamma-glutamyl-gamma-aminobutyrate hydrolase PuuD